MSWVADVRDEPLQGGKDGRPSANDTAAKRDALARAQPDAESLCKDLEAGGQFQFVSATPIPDRWQCGTLEGGRVCGFFGKARCTLRAREVVVRKSCEKPPP